MGKNITLLVVVMLVVAALPFASSDGSGLAEAHFNNNVVNAVQWNPSGELLAVGYDREVRILDTAMAERAVLETGHIRTLRWSPDGNTLVVGNLSDKGAIITVWDVPSNTVEYEISASGTEDTIPMAWSPDGAFLAIAAGMASSGNTSIAIIDLASQQAVRTLPGHSLEISDLAWSPDGQYLASAGGLGGGAFLWDLNTGRAVLHISHRGIFSVAFNQDGTLLATGGRDGVVHLWDTATGQVQHTLEGHTTAIRLLDWQADNLASVGFDHTISIWNTATNQLMNTVEVGSVVFGFDWHPDGKTFACGGVAGELVVFTFPLPHTDSDPPTEDAADQGFPLPTVQTARWSPDGRLLAVGGTSGLRVIDVATQQDLAGFRTNTSVYAVAWSPDGSMLASTGANTFIDVWEVRTGRLNASLPGNGVGLAAIQWSPDGTKLANVAAAVDINNTLQIWDAADYELVAEIGAGPVAEAIWLADNEHLLLVTTTGGVLKISLSSPPAPGSSLLPYHIGPEEPCGAIALHPDGKTLAISSFHRPVIYLWDIEANEQIGVLHGHTDFVLEMDWRLNADILVSIGLDGTLRAWEASAGTALFVFDARTKLYTVAWHPDGQQLVYGGETPNGKTKTLGIIKFPAS